MGAAFFPFLFFTAFWAGVGILIPMLLPKSKDRNLVRCILMLTAVCCWLFWVCCYMAQMNPLVGPKLKQGAVLMVAKKWGSKV